MPTINKSIKILSYFDWFTQSSPEQIKKYKYNAYEYYLHFIIETDFTFQSFMYIAFAFLMCSGDDSVNQSTYDNILMLLLISDIF